jgi:hypothetical protein
MKVTRVLYSGVATLAVAVFLTGAPGPSNAQQSPPQSSSSAVEVGAKDIGGLVSGPNGPEAGVWVIAETTDLPTKYVKIVVTDDQGRYLVPDLPAASYQVWVRGYGLVDSPKVTSTPGKSLNLTSVPAPNKAAAAKYYPAIYWYAMLGIPDKSDFPGTGAKGNGMPVSLKDQAQWLDNVKTDGCYTCHQLGSQWTRQLSPQLGTFQNSADAWARRIQSGQAMQQMVDAASRFDTKRALGLFADWTDRIAAGELPFAEPTRPQGIERNLVVTLWDWAGPTVYLHDEISTDRRDPTVNANGLIYGSPEESTDFVPVLDPVHSTTTSIQAPYRDPKTPSSRQNVMAPSPIWGADPIWDSHVTIHNPMMDEKGRVWFTHRIRGPDNPAFCKAGSSHPSAKVFPINTSGRQLSMYDPATKKFTLIDTCFPTHHLVFASDADRTLWTSAGGPASGVVGWLNTKMFEETGDEQKSQGWTPVILDTVGTGKRVAWTEPGQPTDPNKDQRIVAALYGVAVNPVDGTIWGSVLGFPGGIVRINPGDNPSETALAEYYEVPFKDPRTPFSGYSPRGFDIDGKGVAWVPLASGQLASFDRSKCKGPLNGPNATGKQCPEGWTLYPLPGPQFRNVSDAGSAEAPYFTWVDQFGTLGLGPNLPMVTGNANESLMALVDGKIVNLRVPYPMGFYAKGMDGRIDDPNGGWKGRGVWTTWGTRTVFHGEGGKGDMPKVAHFEMRPDPLAD